MPFLDGRLSEIEVRLADSNLQLFWLQNGGRKPCPTCGSEQYYIIPQLNGNRSDALNPSDPHFRFPTIMVTCQKCGYLDQYLATALGVNWLTVPTPPPVDPPQPNALLDIGSGGLLGALKARENKDG